MKFRFHSLVGLMLKLLLLCAVIAVVFDYRYQMMSWLDVKGSTGIIRSVLVMTVFCIIPIPAEVAMVANVRAHGVLVGTWVNFTGAILGAEILFLFARFVRQSFIFLPTHSSSYKLLISGTSRKRTIWLLLWARILPVPAKVVDLTAGILKSISWWDFTWTTAVGILPYQFLVVFIYRGWRTHRFNLVLIPAIVVTVIFLFARMIRRKKLKSE